VNVDGWWAASYVVLWIVVIVLGVVVVALARQIGTLHLRLGPTGALEMDEEGPPIGEAPEPIEAVTTNGDLVVVGGPGEHQMLLFVSPGCMVCKQVLPSIHAVSGDMTPYVITDVDRQESTLAFARENGRVPVIPGKEIGRAYDVPGTPYVIVLDRSGVVQAKGTVNNLEQMEGLIDTARRRISEATQDHVG
jgi:methylamine dehydrogenase accessory protein MauD